jgi:hypothetical protein
MPALRALMLWRVALLDATAAELYGAQGAAPGLRTLATVGNGVALEAARAIAAAGWRLEELSLRFDANLGAAGVATRPRTTPTPRATPRPRPSSPPRRRLTRHEGLGLSPFMVWGEGPAPRARPPRRRARGRERRLSPRAVRAARRRRRAAARRDAARPARAAHAPLSFPGSGPLTTASPTSHGRAPAPPLLPLLV